jgi:large subunit ribosomal protein L4
MVFLAAWVFYSTNPGDGPIKVRSRELDSNKELAVATETATPISLPVVNAQGQSVGSVEVDPADLGGKVNKQLLHDAVLMYLANQRAGTHSTLRRGEVAGSTKKLFRQKGTGNARVGTRRSNKRKGGGTAKGPKPRDYEYHLPKKAVQTATKMAILSRIADSEAVVIDGLKFTEVKTKQVADVLKALQIADKTCLISLGKSDIDEKRTIYLSARNIRGMEVLPASQLNAYEVLRPKKLVLTKAALQELCKNAKWK